MRIFVVSLLTALSVLPAAALADPTSDLVQMQESMAAVKSMHADITTEKGQHVSMDMIPPDKYHETLPGGMQMIVISGDAWAFVNGAWMKMPGTIPQSRMAMMDNTRTAGINGNQPKDYTITDAGPSTVGTAPAEKYHLVNTKTNDTVDLWIGKDHLPLQAVAPSPRGGTVTIVYSEYNSVPDITPPQ